MSQLDEQLCSGRHCSARGKRCQWDPFCPGSLSLWQGHLLHMLQIVPELGVCDYPSREDLWVREGKILNPEKLFFDEKGSADVQLDCKDSIITPGFIDVQINGTVKLRALTDWGHPGFVNP